MTIFPFTLETPVQIKDFGSVFSAINEQAPCKWKQIGQQLNLDSYKLEGIAEGVSDDFEKHMSKVFTLWKQQSLRQTWNDLIKAVKQTKVNPQLCEDLETQHKEGLLGKCFLVPQSSHTFKGLLELYGSKCGSN